MSENLDKSKHYIGENIKGQFIVTSTDNVSLTNATVQLLVKADFDDSDEEALANLTLGNGLTQVSNTGTVATYTFLIPGSTTENLVATNPRSPIVDIFYEINITYQGHTYSDVLEIGTLKIDTRRLKKNLQ